MLQEALPAETSFHRRFQFGKSLLFFGNLTVKSGRETLLFRRGNRVIFPNGQKGERGFQGGGKPLLLGELYNLFSCVRCDDLRRNAGRSISSS